LRALSVDVPSDGTGVEPVVNGETQPERRKSSLEVHLLVLAVRLAVPGQRINVLLAALVAITAHAASQCL
jgi:hypothetical protein